ncbi:unnamed protein product [Lota lota]
MNAGEHTDSSRSASSRPGGVSAQSGSCDGPPVQPNAAAPPPDGSQHRQYLPGQTHSDMKEPSHVNGHR